MRNKIFMITSFLAVVLVVTSCLKDKVGEDWTSSLKGKMYAQFANGAFDAAKSFTISPTASDQEFKILINIATDALPTSDITLNLAADPTAMEAFSDQVQAGDTSIHWRYEMYPSYTIIDNPVTIKAGTRNAYVHIKISRADTIRLTAKYMLPISITDATSPVVIAENMKTILYSLPIANKWEGTYSVKGQIIRAGDPVLSGFYHGRTYKLGTNGPSSIIMNKGNAWADSETDYAGGIGPWVITISEPSNTIKVSDPTNAAVQVDVAYPNRYDPATRTFYFHAYWGGGLGVREITDTLVYSGSY